MKHLSRARNMLRCLYLLVFCEGFLSCQTLAIHLFYSKTCDVPLGAFSAVASIAGFVPLANPIFGFVVDRFALFGYHKKSYLAIVALSHCVCYAALAATRRPSLLSARALLAIAVSLEALNQCRSVLVAAYSIMANQYAERTAEPSAATRKGVSRREVCALCGRLCATLLIPLYDLVGHRFLLSLAAANALVFLIALTMPESRPLGNRGERRLRASVAQTFGVIRAERLGWMLVSGFVVQSAPFLEVTLKFYLQESVGFGKFDLSVRSLVSRLSMLFAVYCFHSHFGGIGRALFIKLSTALYSLAVFVLYAIVAAPFASRALPYALAMLFAAIHSFFVESRKIAFLAILLEKSPLKNQTFFATIMFYFDCLAQIVALSLSAKLVRGFHIGKGDYSMFPIYVLAHIIVCLIGSICLALCPFPIGNRETKAEIGAECEVRGDSPNETLNPIFEQIWENEIESSADETKKESN